MLSLQKLLSCCIVSALILTLSNANMQILSDYSEGWEEEMRVVTNDMDEQLDELFVAVSQITQGQTDTLESIQEALQRIRSTNELIRQIYTNLTREIEQQ